MSDTIDTTEPGAEQRRETPRWRDIYYTVHDGLRLHARDYGNPGSTRLPVLCLAGLTRNARDFHDLAVALSTERRVICPDYRGRGLSDHADDWRSYTPAIELADTLALLTLTGVEHAVVVGTSRGGIIAMLMAAMRPAALKAAVLNDIGPEIAAEGLLRIRGYLEHGPQPANWEEAVNILKRTNSGFEDMSDAEWLAFARRVFRDVRNRPRRDFDPNLSRTFISYEDVVYDRVPSLWPQFAALASLPTLVIRGENSDLLTPDIIAKMEAVHPRMSVLEVPKRGHTPFLDEPGVVRAIVDLCRRVDPPQLFD